MTEAPRGAAPSTYQLRIAGHLDAHWSARFADFTLAHDDDGTTVLTGDVADQAGLHGLLARIRDLGVTLVSVAVLEPPATPPSRTCP